MARKFKFYIDGVLREVQLEKLIQKTDDFSLVDIYGNIYQNLLTLPQSDTDLDLPNTLWVKRINSTNWRLMLGTIFVLAFNPVSGNLILNVGAVASENVVPVSKGGTGFTSLSSLATALGLDALGDLAIEDVAPLTKGGTGVTSLAALKALLTLGTAAYLNVGTSGNQILQLDVDGKIPAVDGSLITNLPSTPTSWIAAVENNSSVSIGITTEVTLLSLSYTPRYNNSIIKLETAVPIVGTVGAQTVSVRLYRDATLLVNNEASYAGTSSADLKTNIPILKTEVSGSTSPRTYTVKALMTGGTSNSPTSRACSLILTEYRV